MASLKDLRVRISSVKSTQKITSAMKMVAAAKLRRAQEKAEAARPYAERMERMISSLAGMQSDPETAPKLLVGTDSDATHLVVLCTSDRGLCGGFNSSLVRDARAFIQSLVADGKIVKILCVGQKGRDQLRREYHSFIVGTISDVGRQNVTFEEAKNVSRRIGEMFAAGEFDVCTLIYATFKSAITQVVTRQQLIPLAMETDDAAEGKATEEGPMALYEFEPSEEEILDVLLPENLAVQVFRGLLENAASEQGARMTAMDNATRNAGEMIDGLTLVYNRTRQATITKELIEIISGAEAV